MLTRFQYAILASIYGLAILVFSLLVYPAVTEESAKVADLAQHRKQKEQLDIKLKEKLRIDKEKQTLVADIASLRNAVPKEANIDLLLIDLERLAKQANGYFLILPHQKNCSRQYNLSYYWLPHSDIRDEIETIMNSNNFYRLIRGLHLPKRM